MGCIRLVLALSVMIAHGARFTEGGLLRLVDANLAVYLFFIMSGFVMALTLEKNYLGEPNGVGRFYANRALRLYPIYLALLALVLAVLHHDDVFRPAHPYFAGFPALADPTAGTWSWRLLLDTASVGIVGSDYVLVASGGSGHHFNPPTWSLATVIAFYIIAPFLVAHLHRFRHALIAAMSAATAAWLAHYGYIPGMRAPFMMLPDTLW